MSINTRHKTLLYDQVDDISTVNNTRLALVLDKRFTSDSGSAYFTLSSSAIDR